MEFPKAIGKVDFDGWMPAVVVNNVDPTGKGRIAVWIPKLMPNISLYTPVKDIGVNLNSSPIKNTEPLNYKKTFSRQVTTCNYLWMLPLYRVREKVRDHDDIHTHLEDGKYIYNPIAPKVIATYEGSVPKEHENIFVMFMDGDPKKGYWLPYAPN